MVNLTIRLGKAGALPGGKQDVKGPSVAPHLVDTELPLLKGVGTVFSEPCAVNFVGVKARRRPGDKVHICVRCNFPIAVYGRLIPCEHVFCLTCAKLDPTCFLCEERVTRIQKMDVLEGIFICGAPGCLRSFLARADFDNHISDVHAQLLLQEQGRLSPEVNVSTSSEAQVQSHQGGPPMRQSSGTLQVILPKKEEPQQRRPPKGVRQDPQGLLGRPVPELRLPDQFPHHRGGDQHRNHDAGNDVDPQRRDWKPQRHSEWDMHVPQGQGETPRPVNGQAAQEQRSRAIRPPFNPEYGPGPVMGMPPMGALRYHEGHLPPPPPGPPPKRTKFNGSGEPIMEPYNWGPGNSANFRGPANFGGGPPNWMPPANS